MEGLGHNREVGIRPIDEMQKYVDFAKKKSFLGWFAIRTTGKM